MTSMTRLSLLLTLPALACWGGSPARPADTPDAQDVSEVPPPPCVKDEDCDDHDVCTADRCDKSAGCVHDPAKDGTACDDGDACTTGDRCKAGTCSDHAGSLDCAPAECHAAKACDPKEGCVHEHLPDSTPCDDKDPCTGGEACKAGECVGAKPKDCDDKDPCTGDSCDGATGDCLHQDQTGPACDDGDPCTAGDHCKTGDCIGGGETDCDDGNPCTGDSCKPGIGCDHAALDAVPCNDGDPCTEDDMCVTGACTGGTALSCDDGNDCTDDTCDKDKGCLHEDHVGSCEDGDPCTAPDTCAGDVCTPGQKVVECCEDDPDCDDLDECTVETCDLATHACKRSGEKTVEGGTGCATTFGCTTGYCDAATGGCGAFVLTSPKLLVGWEIASDIPPPGFVWTKPGGDLTAEGARVAEGFDGTAFRLPDHFVPAGVKVVYLHANACEGVGVVANQQTITTADCAPDGASMVAAFTWVDGATVKTAVEVTIGPAAVVSRVAYHAWASPTCQPLASGLVVEGQFCSRLASAANWRSDLIGYGDLGLSSATVLDFDRGATEPLVLEDAGVELGVVASSAAALPDGRFVFAWEPGGNPAIRLALIDGQGTSIATGKVAAFTPTDEQHEPVLATGPKGGLWLAWASNKADGDGQGVAVAEIKVTADSVAISAPVTACNTTAAGNQHGPALAVGDAWGIVAWLSEGSAEPKSQVVARGLTAKGLPNADLKDLVLAAEPSIVYSHVTATVSGDKGYVLWQAGGTAIGGAVVGSDFLAKQPVVFGGDPAPVRSSPALLSWWSGAVAVYTRGTGQDAEVVMARIDPDGTVKAEVAIAGKVDAETAWTTAARAGPWAIVHAETNTLYDPPGIYAGFMSGSCLAGPIDCQDPSKPMVCIGFGDGGYIEVPGATWCAKPEEGR